jgi:hypothetical protein
MLATQTRIQFKKLSWLLLAGCFVLLYSCPVKKYLLLTFGNGRATETQSLQFQKDVYSHTEKIVYLRRQSAKTVITIAGQAVRPVVLPVFHFFAATPNDSREAIGKAVLARNRAVGGAPPLWLGTKQLLI